MGRQIAVYNNRGCMFCGPEVLVLSRIFGALVAGLIAWITISLITSKKNKDDNITADAMTRQEISKTIKAGRKLTIAMRQASYRLMQLEVKKEIEDLCKIAESMFEMLKRILMICVSSSSS